MTRYRGIIFCIFVSLYVLCQFRVVDGRTSPATTSKAPSRKTTAKNNVKSASKLPASTLPTSTLPASVLPAKTGGQIITLKFGGSDGRVPVEQCECKPFYLCAMENVVYSAEQRCNENNNNMVCCKVETETEPPLIFAEHPPHSLLPAESSTIATPTYPEPRDCRCVPTEQCQRTYETDDYNILKRKTSLCNTWEYCCPEENIVPTTPSQDWSPLPPTYTAEDECGLKNPGLGTFTRIVSPNDNMKNTSFGEYPWMALLLLTEIDSTTGQRLENVFVCGASLISPKLVLTAAHCVHNVSDVNLLKVRVGEYDTNVGANGEQKSHHDRQVSRIRLHPQFNPRTLHNNLALLEVRKPFTFDYHVRPICIPSTSNEYEYDPNNCVATGWGKNEFGPKGEYSTSLKKVDLAIVSHDRCQEDLRRTRLGPSFVLHSSFICAGGQAGMDTCEGDGGGPLMCLVRNSPNKYVQVGIVSWGIECANGLPAAYANVEKNLAWLTQEINAATEFSSSYFGDRRQ